MADQEQTVLVVEDEAPLRHALRDKLSREGTTVFEARDGEEGLEIALAKHPKVILLDVIMPKMDGLTMLKKLREDEWGETAHVIVLTNLGDTGEVTNMPRNEVFEYLVKSDIKLEYVIERVKAKLAA